MYKNVYSEFEARKQYIKISGKETSIEASCVGSVEEELEVKVITKKCRGVTEREKVKPTGNGTLKESLHIPYELYLALYGMEGSGLIDGVHGYGQGLQHPEFQITMEILDEDDEIKYKAYPRCIIEGGPSGTIENGAEEVAESEVEITLLPDEYGMCRYEALASKLSEEVANKWLTEFTAAMVQNTTK
jgi:hypothetical protein